MISLGEKILEFLKERDMTQRDLANTIGATEITISRYVRDERQPNAEMLSKIATALNVTTDALLGRNILESDNTKSTAAIDVNVNLIKMSNGGFKVSYINPIKNNERITQEFTTDTLSVAYKVQEGIQFLLENEDFHNPNVRNIAKNSLLASGVFNDYLNIKIGTPSKPLIETILYLFYSEAIEEEKIINFLDDKILLPNDAPKVMFLGKFGIGKSTIIKKFTTFGDHVNFPFTDTSRTTTYKTEYVFRHETRNSSRFAVTFMSYNDIRYQIAEAIDRAVETAIDIKYEPEDTNLSQPVDEDRVILKDSKEDKVIKSFYSDPNSLFDIRYLIGSYIRTASPNRNNKKHLEANQFWEDIYSKLNILIAEVENYKIDMSQLLSAHKNNDNDRLKEILKSRYFKYISEIDSGNYADLISYIFDRIRKNTSNIIDHYVINKAIFNDTITRDDKNDWITGFHCSIESYEGLFYDFIKVFTSKNSKDFGKAITPLITGMRIELPYNGDVDERLSETPLVLIDTIGINHSNDENSSIENSTNLKLDEVDVITIVDDSRGSMSLDTINIFKHLYERVVKRKIFLAYTFFDEFSKKEFEEDESEEYLDMQKEDYLTQLQNSKLSSTLKDSKSFISELCSQTYFMKNITSPTDNYFVVNKFLSGIQEHYKIYNSLYFPVPKLDNSRPLIEYDYKKLSLIYFSQVRERYFDKENMIYIKQPPHYKVTEALTRRLSYGQTYYIGAASLKPVDDLYSIMLDNLYPFILNPKDINFDTNKFSIHVDRILEKVKEIISEKLAEVIEAEFVSRTMQITWDRLYKDYGSGSDGRRRKGIISAMGTILPDQNTYLVNFQIENIIDKVENVFIESVDELEVFLRSK